VRPATTWVSGSSNGASSPSSHSGTGRQSESANTTTSAVVAANPMFLAR